MPKQVDLFWQERMKSVRANNPTWGARRICTALEMEGQKQGRGDAPSERWVSKRLRQPPTDLAEYREFRWPESMLRGDLPWESSSACLELLLRCLTASASTPAGWVDPRPSVRVARAFWRLTLAAPGLSAEEREKLARVWAAREVAGVELQDWRDMEAYLAFRPWLDDAHRQAYEDAVNTNLVPYVMRGASFVGDADGAMIEDVLTEFGSSRQRAHKMVPIIRQILPRFAAEKAKKGGK